MKPPQTIEIDMGWIRGLTTEERTEFYQQATDLGALFGPRERENITGVFLNMASLALYIGPHADDAAGRLGPDLRTLHA